MSSEIENWFSLPKDESINCDCGNWGKWNARSGVAKLFLSNSGLFGIFSTKIPPEIEMTRNLHHFHRNQIQFPKMIYQKPNKTFLKF